MKSLILTQLLLFAVSCCAKLDDYYQLAYYLEYEYFSVASQLFSCGIPGNTMRSNAYYNLLSADISAVGGSYNNKTQGNSSLIFLQSIDGIRPSSTAELLSYKNRADIAIGASKKTIIPTILCLTNNICSGGVGLKPSSTNIKRLSADLNKWYNAKWLNYEKSIKVKYGNVRLAPFKTTNNFMQLLSDAMNPNAIECFGYHNWLASAKANNTSSKVIDGMSKIRGIMRNEFVVPYNFKIEVMAQNLSQNVILSNYVNDVSRGRVLLLDDVYLKGVIKSNKHYNFRKLNGLTGDMCSRSVDTQINYVRTALDVCNSASKWLGLAGSGWGFVQGLLGKTTFRALVGSGYGILGTEVSEVGELVNDENPSTLGESELLTLNAVIGIGGFLIAGEGIAVADATLQISGAVCGVGSVALTAYQERGACCESKGCNSAGCGGFFNFCLLGDPKIC